MRKKYNNYEQFTPSKLPAEFRGKFSVRKTVNKNDYSANEVYWTVEAKLSMDEVEKLFVVLDKMRTTNPGEMYMRVWNPKFAEWIYNNGLQTNSEFSETYEQTIRVLSVIKFKYDYGKITPFDFGCYVKKNIFGKEVCRFEVVLRENPNVFINEYGEIEKILTHESPVYRTVMNLPIFTSIKRENDRLIEQMEQHPTEKPVEKPRIVRFVPARITAVKSHYILEVHGGNNGSSNWVQYINNFCSLFNDLNKVYDTWLISFDNDCCDDVHTIYLGFREKKPKDDNGGRKSEHDYPTD